MRIQGEYGTFAELFHQLNVQGASVTREDSQLIDEVLGGDAQAFNELVRKYQSRLYNTLVHVSGSPDEAEDLMQDAFVQAYVKLNTFRGNSAFYTWLYRIAFNLYISRKRKKRLREYSIERGRELAGSEPVDDGEMPGDRLMRAEQVEQIHDALGTLSDEHRSILVLREIEGCCYETIAEILDLPGGTVRSRLHRARKLLRDQLHESLQENPIE